MIMKQDEQRIAIAEWAGWENIQPGPDPIGVPPGPIRNNYRELPEYTIDLNAMAEAEARLTTGQLDRYADIACDMVADGDPDPNITGLITLTAAQRAEALLRTLNLWKEE